MNDLAKWLAVQLRGMRRWLDQVDPEGAGGPGPVPPAPPPPTDPQ